MEYVSFFLILQQNSETRWFLFSTYNTVVAELMLLFCMERKKKKEDRIYLFRREWGRGIWWWSVGNKWVRSQAKRFSHFPLNSQYPSLCMQLFGFPFLPFSFLPHLFIPSCEVFCSTRVVLVLQSTSNVSFWVQIVKHKNRIWGGY